MYQSCLMIKKKDTSIVEGLLPDTREESGSTIGSSSDSNKSRLIDTLGMGGSQVVLQTKNRKYRRIWYNDMVDHTWTKHGESSPRDTRTLKTMHDDPAATRRPRMIRSATPYYPAIRTQSRKKTIKTPNILATSHRFPLTRAQYFISSRCAP
jgi:hypothetical protein